MAKEYPNQDNDAMALSLSGVGLAIKRGRQAQGLSQEHFAALAGVERGFVGKVERGEANPSFTTLQKLAGALKRPLSEFLRECEEIDAERPSSEGTESS